ncbi:hypothetical protein XAP6164_5440009 [Xanthomonas phaseoli pv. phaseoli]|nr:hypothetical protein XAP6164_5440009 [Xanthomonas phaseoli pv. phaseoli]
MTACLRHIVVVNQRAGTAGSSFPTGHPPDPQQIDSRHDRADPRAADPRRREQPHRRASRETGRVARAGHRLPERLRARTLRRRPAGRIRRRRHLDP